ncbi:hypothetical protein RQP46_002121 [Phenoliferia psychrophenolica]
METLPTELLTHILHLSNEGESAQQAQRNLIGFRLVARAFFLAVADSTSFYVGSEKQAKALILKLENEKKWAAQEERKAPSGRTTRSTLSITRVSHVRRISIKLEKKAGAKVLPKLLLSTPELISLELDLEQEVVEHLDKCLDAFEVALGGLADLRELAFLKFVMIRSNQLARMLIPLKGLETLDLANQIKILNALSTIGLQDLDVGSTHTGVFRTAIDTFVPLVANLAHFRHSPNNLITILDENWNAWLKVLGAMTALKSLIVSLYFSRPGGTPYPLLDQSFFDTLATLPFLQSVNLDVSGAKLDNQSIAAFITAHPSLKTLSIVLKKPLGQANREDAVKVKWTQEQQDRVQAVAEEAGVAFKYEEKM